MDRKKIVKSKEKQRRQISRSSVSKEMVISEIEKRQRYFTFFTAAVLFAFGFYHSLLYFGHKVVPNPDFEGIYRVGRELLSFRIPSKLKVAPVTGLLQNALTPLFKGTYPHLKAAWLLNSVLHPFNVLLLWLVGKKLLGKNAAFFAVIAILNPWTMYQLTEPMIETTFMFFILLTFYLILIRSRWAYVLASVTAMVRYEGAALIIAAFIMDLLNAGDNRQRIKSFLYAALASLPLIIWLAGTALTWQSGSTHYLRVLFDKDYVKHVSVSGGVNIGLLSQFNVLWRVTLYPLLIPFPGAGQDFAQGLWKFSKLFFLCSFLFGSVYGLFKRYWSLLILLIFFLPYFVLHAYYLYQLGRFYAPTSWIALLICWFGLQSAWNLLLKSEKVPRWVLCIIQLIVAVVVIIWGIKIFPYLPELSRFSPRSVSLPYVAIGVVTLILVCWVAICRPKHLLGQVVLSLLLILMLGSNQFVLVHQVRDGQRDKEFKLLADWYLANAKVGEKMAVYNAAAPRMFVGERAKDIVGLPKADSPSALVEACCKQEIVYVVWASREGLTRGPTGYRMLGLDKNIAVLRYGKDIGPYRFLTQIRAKVGYVNVYRLEMPAK